MNHNLILSNEPDEQEDAHATIVFNISFSNVDNSHVINTSRNDSHQNIQQCQKNDKGMPLAIHDMKSFVVGNIKTYKWHIATALAVSSYGLLCYHIIKGNYYLQRSDLWSSWRKELSLDEMLAIPHYQFAQDLFREIQNRYNKDFATSLMLFMESINQEEKDIKFYQSLYKWISFFHVQKLTPLNKATYENCTHQLQKIAYYKGCIESLKDFESEE